MRKRRSLLWTAPGVPAVLGLGWLLLVPGAPEDVGEPGAASADRPGAPVRSASFDEPARPPAPSTVALDAARIGARLVRVERRLRGRPPAGLSERQRRRRERALRHLREYRTRGIFPVNSDFPGRRVPYFVDRKGTLCALAYLIWRSGHRNLVAEVAATHNNGRVRELASNARLREWLRRHGLTVEEASMIQPSYEGDDCVACVTQPEQPERSVDAGFVIASALGSGLSVWSGLSNASDLAAHGSGSAVTGIAGGLAGGAAAALGATRFDTEGASLAVGIADAAIGVAAAALGTANLLSGDEARSPLPGSREEESASGPSGPSLSLRPYALTADGVRRGIGVSLTH